MFGPDPALAPEMPPVIAPTVQVKVLAGSEAVNAIFVGVALQIVYVTGDVKTGVGLTVTVIMNGVPTQDPVADVGVTIYCTVPGVAMLGLVSI